MKKKWLLGVFILIFSSSSQGQEIPEPIPRGPMPDIAKGFETPETRMWNIYRFYFQELFRTNYRKGLVAWRRNCRDQNYSPCVDRFDGYSFSDTTIFSGWLMAALARDYSLSIHPREETLARLHEMLDAWNRLSKYAHTDVIHMSRELSYRDYATMLEEYEERSAYMETKEPTGFIIRQDLDAGFHRFVQNWQTPSDVDPSIDQYSHMIFALVCVRTYVRDPEIREKVAGIAERIQNYLHKYDFTMVRPWDGKKCRRGNRAGKFRYPFSVAFRYLIDDDSKWKPIENEWLWRKVWYESSDLLAASARLRCDKNQPGWKPLKCHYFNDVMYFVSWASLRFEKDSSKRRDNFKEFRKIYMGDFLEFDRSPLLAFIAHHFFDVSFYRPGMREAFSTLLLAPTDRLPNSYNFAWYGLMHESPSYRDGPLRLHSKDSREGTQKSGVDYLMAYSFRFPSTFDENDTREFIRQQDHMLGDSLVSSTLP